MKYKLPSELAACVNFHGHLCPGLTIGFLAAKLAMEKMRWKRSMDEEMLCIAMSDGCAVDAIQYMTGCTLGKGNLIFKDLGKMVFIFLVRKKGHLGKGIRVSFRIPADWKKPGKKKVSNKEQAALDLLGVSEEKLFSLSMLRNYPMPERARIFPSRPCASCGEATMEPRLKIKDGKLFCLECAPESYSRGW
jgi:formylmethanofuran dehydrogenase subunit E